MRGNTQRVYIRKGCNKRCLPSFIWSQNWMKSEKLMNKLQYSHKKKWDTITQWKGQSLAIQNSKINSADIMLKPGTIKYTLYYYIYKLKRSLTNLQ